MNDEERQRTIDFILQQQAKTEARLDKLLERDAQADARMARLAERDEQADARTARLERVLKLAIKAGLRERREWRERYAALVDAQIRTEDATRGQAERLSQLEELTRRNSEDIGRLARIVERTATGQNGGDAA